MNFSRIILCFINEKFSSRLFFVDINEEGGEEKNIFHFLLTTCESRKKRLENFLFLFNDFVELHGIFFSLMLWFSCWNGGVGGIFCFIILFCDEFFVNLIKISSNKFNVGFFCRSFKILIFLWLISL